MLDSQNPQNVSKLIELNEELENYFRNTIIPQLLVDANLILRKYTPPAMTQFSFVPDDIGKPIRELIDNIRHLTIIEDIHEVVLTGEILEKEIQTTDLKWFQMNIIPYIVQKKNKPNGVIITFVDITERINDIKELEKLNAAYETFIYSVSHDLKGPLGNIESLIQIMTLPKNSEMEQKSISAMLDKSVKSMRNIIDELSEIIKIEGHYQEKIETVSFRQILKEVELIIRDKIIQSRAHLYADIREPVITFSRKNIRSIIYNLLSNAIKYKSPSRPPEISIKTETENGFVVMSVKDNGIGIPKEKIGFIFSKFTRVEKNVEGTGIGLYLVKKIVDNNGGKIMVNSTVGEGSEFKIYLKSKAKS